MNVQTKRAIGFGIAHFIVLVACYLTAFILAMERFEKYDVNVSAMEYVTGSLTEILMSPGRYIWTSWASKNLHNAFEWILLIANSALWGVALAYVFGKIKRAT
jgi:hypothetical protein